MKEINFHFEFKRKLFHLYALIAPLIYLFISKIWMVSLLFITLLCTLYLDITRHYNQKIKVLVNNMFSGFIRAEETSGLFKLSGASFMISGLFLSALLFSKELAITTFLILIISDCAAALVGVRFGHNIMYGKSLEGSIAFFATAVLVSMLCYFYIGYNTSFITILIACIVATVVEFYSGVLNINDNLLIPLAYGFTTSVFNFISGL